MPRYGSSATAGGERAIGSAGSRVAAAESFRDLLLSGDRPAQSTSATSYYYLPYRAPLLPQMNVSTSVPVSEQELPVSYLAIPPLLPPAAGSPFFPTSAAAAPSVSFAADVVPARSVTRPSLPRDVVRTDVGENLLASSSTSIDANVAGGSVAVAKRREARSTEITEVRRLAAQVTRQNPQQEASVKKILQEAAAAELQQQQQPTVPGALPSSAAPTALPSSAAAAEGRRRQELDEGGLRAEINALPEDSLSYIVARIWAALKKSLATMLDDFLRLLSNVDEVTVSRLTDIELEQQQQQQQDPTGTPTLPGGTPPPVQPQQQQGYFQRILSLLPPVLWKFFAGAAATVGNVSVSAIKSVISAAKWLYNNVKPFVDFVTSHPTLTRILLYVAKIIKDQFCRWLSIKLGYVEFKLSTFGSRTEDTYQKLKTATVDMVWLFFPELVQAFISQLGTLLEWASGTIGTAMLAVLGIVSPVALAVLAGLRNIFAWSTGWITEAMRLGLQEAFFAGENIYLIYSSVERLFFDREKGCLDIKIVRIGSDIKLEDYKKYVLSEPTVTEEFVRGEIDYDKAKGNEFTLVAWFKDNVTRQTPMVKDLKLTDDELTGIYKVYYDRLAAKSEAQRLYDKLFDPNKTTWSGSAENLTEADTALATDISNFQFYLKGSNSSLRQAAAGTNDKVFQKMFRIANRLVPTPTVAPPEKTLGGSSIISNYLFM